MEQKKTQTHIKSCPICGSSAFTTYLETKDYFLTQEDFKLVQCEACGFIFTNPIPDPSDLERYYNSPDYLSHTVSKWNITGYVYKAFRYINIRNKYKLVRHYKKGGRILDIGLGTGELLSFFKRKGWDVIGIEPNEMAREYAIEKYGIEVFDEQKLNELSNGGFDVITLWHVLEHVPDLDERMRQIKELIKKDGFVIIAVPNIESPDAKKYGDHWAGLDVPRHLYHFSDNSINNLLKKYDLELVKKYPMRFDAYYVCLLSEWYRQKKFPFISAFINGLRSNLAARKDNNYSSMIFVAKQN